MGDQGPQLAGLNKIFYDPEAFNILPYKNTYQANGQVAYTGFFIPSYEMWFGTKDYCGFDSRGVVDTERAKKYYLDKWSETNDPKALIKNKAEYCFTPEDAFALEGSNRFDQELLVDQLHAITIHKTVDPPRSIKLHWKLDENGNADRNKRPTVEFCSESPIQIVELPEEGSDGQPYMNLYVSGCDSIDQDSTTATGQTDTSQFCMTIMRRQFGLKSPKIVAIYKDRPSHIQMAFDTALKLCMFYNCKMLVEATRISIKQYFEKEHKLDFLMRRPKATANSWGKTNFKQFGCPATEHIIQHQLDLIEQYIVDYSDQIQFPEMLEELIRYSYENKRKFDIVAALGMTMLADEDMIGRTARTTTPVKNRPVITYVKNEWGQIELQAVYQNQNELVDGTRVQSSEPTQMYISARF